MLKSILSKIFGDKSAKDQKEYQPFVDKINSFFVPYSSLTDDELRAKTAEFKARIKENTKEIDDKLNSLQTEADQLGTEISRKEDIYGEIDGLKEQVNNKIEEALLEVLPEAFAVVKETARRWATNGKLEVVAQDFDRDRAAVSDGVSIEGDRAIWHNKWTAAGTHVEWNMVHYDVQLMGGAVLHKGNIA
jgi:preprotein translocase subunit SecA